MLGTCSTHVTESRMEASLSEDLILPSPENSSNGKMEDRSPGESSPCLKNEGATVPQDGSRGNRRLDSSVLFGFV